MSPLLKLSLHPNSTYLPCGLCLECISRHPFSSRISISLLHRVPDSNAGSRHFVHTLDAQDTKCGRPSNPGRRTHPLHKTAAFLLCLLVDIRSSLDESHPFHACIEPPRFLLPPGKERLLRRRLLLKIETGTCLPKRESPPQLPPLQPPRQLPSPQQASAWILRRTTCPACRPTPR